MYSEGNKFVLLLFTLSVAPVKASAAALTSVKASAAALANAFCWVVVSCLCKSTPYLLLLAPSYNVQHYFLKNSMLIYHNFQKTSQKYCEKCKSIWESYKYLTIGCPKKNFTRTLGVILKQTYWPYYARFYIAQAPKIGSWSQAHLSFSSNLWDN